MSLFLKRHILNMYANNAINKRQSKVVDRCITRKIILNHKITLHFMGIVK